MQYVASDFSIHLILQATKNTAKLWVLVTVYLGSLDIFPLLLARYVSDCMGGVVQRSGTFGFELPLGEVQKERQSNVVPLGEVGVGVFQHRALLFKVKLFLGRLQHTALELHSRSMYIVCT